MDHGLRLWPLLCVLAKPARLLLLQARPDAAISEPIREGHLLHNTARVELALLAGQVDGAPALPLFDRAERRVLLLVPLGLLALVRGLLVLVIATVGSFCFGTDQVEEVMPLRPVSP